MPIDVSHFTMVGFALDTGNQTTFAQQSGQLASTCQAATLDDAHVICVIKDPSGAELRIGLKRNAASGPWSTAGFTTTVQNAPNAPNGNGWTVNSQDVTALTDVPCSSVIRVNG